MSETPEEKARKYGVPLIPRIKPIPTQTDPIAICGECGLEIPRGAFGYCCPQPNCPCGFGGVTCLTGSQS